MVKVVDCARIQRLQAGCVHRIGLCAMLCKHSYTAPGINLIWKQYKQFWPCGADTANKPRRIQLAEPQLAISVLYTDYWEWGMDSEVAPSGTDEQELHPLVLFIIPV